MALAKMRLQALMLCLAGAASLSTHHLGRQSEVQSEQSEPLFPEELKEQLSLVKDMMEHESDLEREAKKGVAEREIVVVSEHANCPDAQCPRAKVYNVGYIGKGYNIIYGNPYPENAGIDSGFTKFGGGGIFEVTYHQERETVDGREEVPDDIVVMVEHGCTLQMTLSEARNSDEYSEMVKKSNSYGGSVGLKFISAAGKASKETMNYDKECNSKKVVKTYAEAMCDAFRVKLNKYSGFPKFTGDFKTMVAKVLVHADAKDKAAQSEAFYDLFDAFGTHYVQGLTLGSKFVLNQNYEKTTWDKLTQDNEAYKQSAEVGLTISTKKAKARKQQKRKKGCPPDPDDKKKGDEKKGDKDPCEASAMDWIKETIGLMADRIGKIEAKAGIKKSKATEDSDYQEENDKSDSRTIISIGAPPSDDALDWARQSVVEAMPIKYSLMPICDLFNTKDADMLNPRKQSKALLGGMEGNASAAFEKACSSALLKGYCKDRVAAREGVVKCEGKLAQRAQHTCKKDADCNTAGTHYECVSGVCKLPYTRVVDLKLVGVADAQTMPACPADYTEVKVGTGAAAKAARLGCPVGDEQCKMHSHLCMLKKDTTTNADMQPVCQLFLANDKPLIGKGMSILEYERDMESEYQVKGYRGGTQVEGRKKWDAKSGTFLGHYGERIGYDFAKKVLFDTCAGCKTEWVGQSAEGPSQLQGPYEITADNDPRNMYLWTESKTCEAYFKPLKCKGFLEFDTCDLSSYPLKSYDDGDKQSYRRNATWEDSGSKAYTSVEFKKGGLLKCDEGENLIGTNRMGYCVCSPTSPNKYRTFSNPFFCGHSSSLNCYDYCRSSAIAPGITDIVASATRTCPTGYELVPMNGPGNGNIYEASTTGTALHLCIQRKAPEGGSNGATRIGDKMNGAGKDAPKKMINNLEVHSKKPSRDHLVKAAIEHFLDESTDTHLHQQASKAGGLSKLGGALASAFEASESRPHAHVAQAVHASIAKPGSLVHPTKGILTAEEDTHTQEELGKELDEELNELEKLEENALELSQEESMLQVSEERRADRALEDTNVNAVLGMGAIGSEPKTKVTVKSQSALCPDAQCPRAKVVNLGYIAKGYNLLYGNPHPKGSGVDPGFTNYGGSDIFKLTYNSKKKGGNGKDPKQTADGRYEIPTALDVVSEHGCSLSFSSESASSVQEYADMEKRATSYSGGLNVGPFFSASFKASNEFQKNEKELTSGTKTTVNSGARCSAYSARLSRDKDQHATFSGDFLAAVKYLKFVGDRADKEEAWYDFFDSFGTHFISWMVLGSRYTMQQIFDKSAYDKLTTTAQKDSVSGDVALGIGPFSASAEGSKETGTDTETKVAKSEDKSDRTITALGAPPAETELEWAKQSLVEAMPIDMTIENICDLFGEAEAGSFPKTGTKSLKKSCDSLLTFDKYCKQRVAPRSGIGVCSAISPQRKSHTCSKDSDCGNKGGTKQKSYECVSGICVLAYTRVFDMHLAFQTPCPTHTLIVKSKPFEYKQFCDGPPICETGYEKVQKVDSTGKPLGVANLNEHLKDKLSADELLDEYVTHLCVRKVSTTQGGGFPLLAEEFTDYGSTPSSDLGEVAQAKLGAGFPVCQAFLSKAAHKDGDGYEKYWENIGQTCGSGEGMIPTYECDHDWKWLEVYRGRGTSSASYVRQRKQMSRVQGIVGCLQRAPGPINQKYTTRGTYGLGFKWRYGTGFQSNANTWILNNMGGISDVNLHNVRCYEARGKKRKDDVYASSPYGVYVDTTVVDTTATQKQVDARKRETYDSDDNGASKMTTEQKKGSGKYWGQGLKTGTFTHECGRWSTSITPKTCGPEEKEYASDVCVSEELPNADKDNGGRSFYKGGEGDQEWSKHCAGAAPPKHLWFQSSTCEKVAEPMTCVSFTQVDCASHKKEIEVFQCDDNNQAAEIAANQAGYCTCKNSAGKLVAQEYYFMCNAHPPTSCQEWCLGKNPQAAVTDIVMVSSADSGKKPVACPSGYELVQSINKGGGLKTPLNEDLNEGRNKEKFPTLYLCQTFQLTSKVNARAAVNEEQQTV